MRTRGPHRLLVLLSAVLLVAGLPLAAAQNATNETGGNQTAANETAGNQTGGAGVLPQPSLTGPAHYAVNVALGEQGASLEINPKKITLPPGSKVTFHVVNIGATEHDFTLKSREPFEFSEQDVRPREDGGQAIKTPLLGPGETYDLTVTIKEGASGTVEYICSVPGHASAGMTGTLTIGAGAAEEKEIVDYGVDYYAYWIGIVSFLIIFIVLFATFFLFRYGETSQTVDHRTGGPKTVTVAAGSAEGEGEKVVEPLLPSPRSVATILALIALIGAAFYFLI